MAKGCDSRFPRVTEQRAPGDAWLADRAAALFDQLGEATFDVTLADILDRAGRFQQFVLFGIPPTGEVHCAYAWHQVSPQRVSPLTSRYVEGKFHRVDPALRHLQRLGDWSLRALRLHASDIDDPDYKRHFFEAADLGHKLSILNDFDGEGQYLNFYKRAGDADFSDQEIDNLCMLARLVCSSIRRHRALMPTEAKGQLTVNAVRTRLEQRTQKLTTREKDVCARIIIGYTAEAIGLDLGIGESSVVTYRKRAYAKLGICSHHELFALCLGGT